MRKPGFRTFLLQDEKDCVLWGVILGCCACMDLPADVEEALALAGGNRRELKAVLRHYRQDSLKFRAACFLIANMRWHYSDDSGYCLYSDAKDSDLCDLRRFDRSFLISHVDHAFDVWESSPCAAGLSFCEFCEYILPYRSLAGYPDCFSGAELYDLFGKYVGAGQGDSLAGYVARYNRVKTDFEGVTGKRLALDSSLYRPLYYGQHVERRVAMKGNRFKQDNRGASLLAVLVLMVVVSLIAVVITKITIVNIEMKEVERGTE